MQISPPKANLGVIVGRFQVNELHPAHRELIEWSLDNYDNTLIILGSSAVPNSLKNPLPYQVRARFIREQYPELQISQIVDCSCNEEWSKKVDRIVKEHLRPRDTAVLIGGRDSFVQHYTGEFNTVEVESLNIESELLSGTQVRSRLAHRIEDDPMFRAGIIYASHGDYDRCLPTIDVALFDEKETGIYLVRKHGEKKFRFPGGFVQAGHNLEDTVYQEIIEEVGNIEYDHQLEYLGSYLIDDWRYRSEGHTIMTTFFKTRLLWGSVKPKDIDEIAEVEFFSLYGISPSNFEDKIPIVAEHKTLMKRLLFKHISKKTQEEFSSVLDDLAK